MIFLTFYAISDKGIKNQALNYKNILWNPITRMFYSNVNIHACRNKSRMRRYLTLREKMNISFMWDWICWI